MTASITSSIASSIGPTIQPENIALDPILADDHPDLLAKYTMDNTSGDILIDESPNGRDVTVTGGLVTRTGIIADGLDFSGATRVTQTPPWGSNPTELCLCGWVQLDVLDNGYWFGHRDSTNDLLQVRFNNTGEIRLQVRSSGTAIQQPESAVVDLTTAPRFLRLNFDRNNDRIELFLDEVSIIVDTTVWAGTISSNEFNLGAYKPALSHEGFMNGMQDEVRFFNRPTTATEGAALFAEVTP